MQCERANKPKDDTWRLLYAGQKTHTSFGRFISSFPIRASRSSEAKIASGNEPNNRSTRSAHLGYDTRIPKIARKPEGNYLHFDAAFIAIDFSPREFAKQEK